MEDQGKRLIIAVAIAFVIMLVWTYVFPPEKPPPNDAAVATEKAAGTAGADKAATPGTATPATAGSPQQPAEGPAEAARSDEQLFEFDTEQFHAVFTSWGGALRSFKLKGARYYDAEVKGPLDLVRTSETDGLPLTLQFDDGSKYAIPPRAEWKGEKINDTELRFSWESKELRVDKSIKLHPDLFLIEMTIDVTKLAPGEAKQELVLSMYGWEDPTRKTKGSWGQVPRAWKSGCLVGDEVKEIKSADVIKKRIWETGGPVKWAGFVHSYFLAAAAVDPTRDPTMTCRITPVEGARAGTMRTDLVFPVFSFKDGDPPYQRRAFIYMGPKYLDLLEGISATVGIEGGVGFEDAVDFGWLSFLSRPLLWLLKQFQSFVVNWGIAIILLTFVVKLATLYWTHKSMKSMKAMAKLRPQLEAIKEKYPDDREKQNVETMNLFKAHGVNPLSGCLPMLLQMPIWFALYRMLMVTAEIYQAPFIAGWIDDLTLPDPYYVLPILLTGMMFVQSKLQPATQTGIQQKMLQYGMPLMFGVFSFFFPAGLTLYIFTNTFLTAVHSLVIHREARAEAKASKGATATAPAKSARKAAEAAEDAGDAEEAGDADDAEPVAAAKTSKPAANSEPAADRPRAKKRKRVKRKR